MQETAGSERQTADKTLNIRQWRIGLLGAVWQLLLFGSQKHLYFRQPTKMQNSELQ
jgi:hypothetical protein